MSFHWISFLAGFILDLLFGDPYWLPHPIRAMGTLICVLEKRLRIETGQKEKRQFRRGLLLVILVLVLTVAAALCVLMLAYLIHPLLGLAAESIMCYQILAVKCLKKESMKVYDRLNASDLEGAKQAVSMIVGRDTQSLDETGVAKAAIETVAENTSDGVIAPMLYLAIGGPVLGFFYKAVNTMDSMIGYKNEKYLYFGRAAAKLDDILNYLPARISAWLMIGAAFLVNPFFREKFDVKNAIYIYKRDRRKHASPNSAHTETVCAGALDIQLAGDASYFGKVVKKPYLGDAQRRVETEDIRRANRLLYAAAFLCEILCLAGIYFLAG